MTSVTFETAVANQLKFLIRKLRRESTKKHRWDSQVVLVSIGVVWVSAMLIGCVPMFGWHPPAPPTNINFTCSFVLVIDMYFMVCFNFFGCVLTPLIIMYATYGYIYRFITRARRIATRNAVVPVAVVGGDKGADAGGGAPAKNSQLNRVKTNP